MGRLWCQGFPLVEPLARATPKPVTFIYPFYLNHSFLQTQFAGWWTYPLALREQVAVIVVDDGSPRPCILPADRPFPMRLFRIDVDVRWNWLAARNIGAHYAADGWLLITDMDHVVPAETLDAIVWREHDPKVIYAFNRREHTGVDIQPHSASFLLTKAMFWKVGGYDETLSGHYGSDGDWRRRCALVAPIHILRTVLIRHEYVDDSSTTTYLRKQRQDAGVRQLIAARRPGWRPKTLSFPFHEVH